MGAVYDRLVVQQRNGTSCLTSRIKAHFTTLLSTISFTLYALLPTLQPQLFETYPVEATSQALQSLSMASSSQSSQLGETSESSLLLQRPDQQSEQNQASREAESSLAESQSTIEQSPPSAGRQSHPGVGESWASEFQSQSGSVSGSESEGGVGETRNGYEHGGEASGYSAGQVESIASSSTSHQHGDNDDAVSPVSFCTPVLILHQACLVFMDLGSR
jgi:hypothetical protein